MNIVHRVLRRFRFEGRSAAQHDPAIPTRATPVNGFDVLEKLARLPVSTWRYKQEHDDVRHLGPMAQDWHATFGLGSSTRHIPLVDAHGVTIVAIQALYQRVAELQAENATLRHRIDQLDTAPTAHETPPPTRQEQNNRQHTPRG